MIQQNLLEYSIEELEQMKDHILNELNKRHTHRQEELLENVRCALDAFYREYNNLDLGVIDDITGEVTYVRRSVISIIR